jgi:hypothetical protein
VSSASEGAEKSGQDVLVHAATVARYLQGQGLAAFVLDHYLRQALSPDSLAHAAKTYLNVIRTFLPGPLADIAEWLARKLVSGSLRRASPIVAFAGLLPVLLLSLVQLVRRTIVEIETSSIFGLSDDIRAALPQIPPLLAVLILLFITGDAWRAFATLTGLRFAIVLLLFFIASLMFLWIGCRTFRRSLFGGIPNIESIAALASQTPARALVDSGIDPLFTRPSFPLRLNVWILVVSSLAARLVGLALWIGVAFLLLGLVLYDQGRIHDLLGGDPHVLVSASLAGLHFSLTWELMTLCSVFGGVAELYFTALGLQDPKVASAFTKDLFVKLEKALAAYDYYRGTVGSYGFALRMAMGRVI